MVAALGPLLPEKNRAAALASESDRIAMPAPRGPNTLVEALTLLNAADIELRDIALRRPSLDDVFLALTSDNTGTPESKGTAIDNARHSADDQLQDIPDDADAHPTGGHRRSWVAAHVRTLVVIAVCAIAVTGVSLFVLKKDSTSGGNEHPAPSVVQAPTPASAPPAPAASLPAAPPPRAAPPPVAVPTQAPIGTLPHRAPPEPGTQSGTKCASHCACAADLARGGRLAVANAAGVARWSSLGGASAARSATRARRTACAVGSSRGHHHRRRIRFKSL